MRERLKHKYALSEQGVNDMIKAVIIVTIANLAFMVPVGLLYLLASDILNGGIPSSKLPMYIGGMVISILLIIITTYGKAQRLLLECLIREQKQDTFLNIMEVQIT